MKITSKFDEGVSVWFLNHMGAADQACKFFEGTVTAVQSWDKWSGFRYDVSHISPDGKQMSYNVMEKDMYKTKNDVLANAFEENGTLEEAGVGVPGDVPAETPAV